MKKSFNTTVSVKDGSSRSVLKGIVQYDTLNEVNIRLTDGSRPFDYTGYTNIILKVRKADGTSYVDSEGNSVIATNPSGGLITVLLKGQATAADGLCQCVIEIYADGEKMTTARLNYEVSDALGTDEDAASESQYPAFQKLLSDLSKIEADATAAGGYATRAEIAAKKAEMWAKGSQNIAEGDFATRAELDAVEKGAAPAGYGLGEKVAPAVADLNDAVATGVYAFSGTAANNPFVSPYIGWPSLAGVVEVSSQNVEQVIQVLKTTYTSTPFAVRRSKYGNEWLPFEWENPPMMPDIEYRTTERYHGFPVYKKLVTFGALPNSTSKTVDVGFGSGFIIGIESIFATNQGYYFFKDESIKKVVATGASIVIATSSDLSAYTVRVLVKYYKST